MLPGITPSLFGGAGASIPTIQASPVLQMTDGPYATFTGIPDTAKKIDLSFWGVSTPAQGEMLFIRLGPTAGVVATGYDSYGIYITPTMTGNPSTVAIVGGPFMPLPTAPFQAGQALLTLIDPATNQWVLSELYSSRVNTWGMLGFGSVSLAGKLARMQVGGSTAQLVTGSFSFLYDTGPVISNPVSLSGIASATFTGIPANAKQIIISFASVKLNTSDNFRLRVGPAGGVATTGYDSHATSIVPTQIYLASTVGFDGPSSYLSPIWNGHMVLTLVDPATNTWVGSWCMGERVTSHAQTVQGSVALSGPLERFSFGSLGGSATFAAGSKIGMMVLT